MIGAPRLLATFGNRESCGDFVYGLENNLYGQMALVLADHFFAEDILEILADNEYKFAESCVYGVIDRVIHDCFTVGTQSVKLFETSVAASHSGSQEK